MIIAVAGLIIVILIILSLKPYKLNKEISSNPAGSYAEATVRIEQIQSAEDELAELNPECGTLLFSKGGKTENVIVFLHGFTSCPDQFSQLGQEYFEKGYNVFIPRLPRHGIKDPRVAASIQSIAA